MTETRHFYMRLRFRSMMTMGGISNNWIAIPGIPVVTAPVMNIQGFGSLAVV
jgi:hypothetical protein